ncbi:MAG: signal peptidase II [Phycisphaerales bacterium]
MSGPRHDTPRAPGDPPPSRPPRPHDALRSIGAWLLLIAVTFVGVAIDLVSKWAAFANTAGRPVEVRREDVLACAESGRSLGSLIPHHEPVTVIPGLLDLTLVLNPGAVFGIGAGKRWFFVAFTVGALGLAIWMFGAWTRARDRAAHVAIGLLLAGGLGNLYDRLVYGCVRDFIHPLPGAELPFGWTVPFTGSRAVWPYVSNLADLWLLIGIGMLMWFLWRGGGRHAARPLPLAPAGRPPAA